MSKTKDLRPDSHNANRGSARGQKQIIGSIQRNGFGRSGLLDKDGRVIAGNKTLEASAEVFGVEADVIIVESDGTKPVYVKRTDLDLDSPDPNNPARRLAYEDNVSSWLSFDLDPAVVMADMESGFNFEAIGVSLDELGEMLEGSVAELLKGDGEVKDALPQIDKAKELQAKWSTALGQVWELGDHRLVIGDCTDPAVVEAVMRGEKAKLLMTSPPYWVGKEYEKEHTWGEVQNFIRQCSKVFSDVSSHRIVINTGAPQAAHLTGERAHVRLLLDDWQRELRGGGFLLRYARIWTKRGGLAHTAPQSDCIDQHWEFIGVFYRPETYEGQRRLGEKWATDGIWDDVPGEMSSHGHIAAFPLEIPSRNIRLYTDQGDVILEPFLGSGTTLIACENLGRKCRGIELDPGYAAVTIQRFVDLGTSRDPIRVSG